MSLLHCVVDLDCILQRKDGRREESPMGLVCCGTRNQDLFWVGSRGCVTHRQFHVFSTADSQHNIHHRYKACPLPNEIFHHAERSWLSFTVDMWSSTPCSEELLQGGSTRIGGRTSTSLRLSPKWAGCNLPSVPSSSSHPPFSRETPSLSTLPANGVI